MPMSVRRDAAEEPTGGRYAVTAPGGTEGATESEPHFPPPTNRGGKSPLSALIDTVSFTVPRGMYDQADPATWGRNLLADFGIPDDWYQGFGRFSYEHGLFHSHIKGLAICWGGERSAGTLYVNLPGGACHWVQDWHFVAEVLQSLAVKLTRVDAAVDDFEGTTYSVQQADADDDAGKFITNGRKPDSHMHDDKGSGKGKTLTVGNRANGKQLRVYEKGREQGHPESPWIRTEVEYRAKDRVLPYEMLYKPAEYVAGAYPALAWASEAKATVRTVKEKALHTVTSLFRHARKAYGQLLRVMVEECGHDPAMVAMALVRDGTPESLRGLPDWSLPEMGTS